MLFPAVTRVDECAPRRGSPPQGRAAINSAVFGARIEPIIEQRNMYAALLRSSGSIATYLMHASETQFPRNQRECQ
jgi:hypothetical protein